jgi:hypothetical protein
VTRRRFPPPWMVEETGTLEGDGMGRMFWAVLFWIWGFLGLALFVFVSNNIPGELLWIGGMMLFGLSALMIRPPD